MSTSTGFIITAQDLPYCEAYTAEEDCAPITGSYQLEEDCACPNNEFVLEQAPLFFPETVSYLTPALHTHKLTPHSYLAFNPLGQAGVAVFNQPVLDLLNVFHQPRSLDEGVHLAGRPSDGLSMAQRLVALDLLEPVGHRRQAQPAPPQTLTAWLHVTNDCNLRCPYCYVDKTPDPMQLELGRRAVEAVFRSAVAHGFRRVKLKYAGGEATLNFALVVALHAHAQRLAEMYHLALDGVVLSNGVSLTKRMIQEMQDYGLRLMISLDGLGEEHNIHRPFGNGHGSFSHVERTLDRLAAHNFTPSISITISKRNLAGLPTIVDYVLTRELPFTLNFYRENDCSASFTDLAYQDEQVIAALKAAFAVIEANLPPYSLLDRLVDLTRLDSMHNRTCGVGHAYMVINQRGGIAKCHMELERTVADITAADPLQLIRDDRTGIQNLAVEEKEGCRDCSWRYWCAGGCPALTYRVTGRYDVKSPNCRIYKAIFPEVLRLEGLRLLKYSSTLPL